MKSLRFLSVALLVFLGSAVSAQSKTDSIKVSGNCGMCKKTIEKALKVPGVSSVNWNKDSKMLAVSYDASKVSLDDVQQKVANAGYDTPKFKASEAAYSALPSCCQYDRAGSKTSKKANKH